MPFVRYMRWAFIVLALLKWGVWDSITRMNDTLKTIQANRSVNNQASPAVQHVHGPTFADINHQLHQLLLPCTAPIVRIELTQDGYQASARCDTQ